MKYVRPSTNAWLKTRYSVRFCINVAVKMLIIKLKVKSKAIPVTGSGGP
jgi:hypothetical protein